MPTDLTALSDDDLYAETLRALRESIPAQLSPLGATAFGFLSALSAESERRAGSKGHDGYCDGSIYSRACEQALAEHAGRAPSLTVTTCRCFAGLSAADRMARGIR